jgi:hypothetical protein
MNGIRAQLPHVAEHCDWGTTSEVSRVEPPSPYWMSANLVGQEVRARLRLHRTPDPRWNRAPQGAIGRRPGEL